MAQCARAREIEKRVSLLGLLSRCRTLQKAHSARELREARRHASVESQDPTTAVCRRPRYGSNPLCSLRILRAAAPTTADPLYRTWVCGVSRSPVARV
jgi:hypothetical protein